LLLNKAPSRLATSPATPPPNLTRLQPPHLKELVLLLPETANGKVIPHQTDGQDNNTQSLSFKPKTMKPTLPTQEIELPPLVSLLHNKSSRLQKLLMLPPEMLPTPNLPGILKSMSLRLTKID